MCFKFVMYRIVTLFFIIFISSFAIADPSIDQWEDSEKTYLDLIQEGFEVKGYDVSNFKDVQGNMYMFFVTVLQKGKVVYECQEYQVFDNLMNTTDLTFVCRKLVKPYKQGLKI